MKKVNYNIQTVEKALDVLESFIGCREAGVTELGNMLQINKNKAFRLLATLESRSYIEQDEQTCGYRLGVKNLDLGLAFLKQMKLYELSRPVLESVTKRSDETTDAAIRSGSGIYYFDTVESGHIVRVMPRLGMRPPAHCTAAGKVLLASASDVDQNRYLLSAEFRKYALNSITDQNELRRHLEHIGARNYAVENEELDRDVRGVAASIRDRSGGAVGAVSIFGPGFRFSMERIFDEFVPLVKGAAEEISAQLGCIPPDLLRAI